MRNKTICPHKDLYVNIHSKTTQNRKNPEKIQIVSTGELTNKNGIFQYNGQLFKNKKDQITDTWYNVDNSQKYHAR